MKRRYARVLKMKPQLGGAGCSALISFKTYYETEEVRVCCKSGCVLQWT